MRHDRLPPIFSKFVKCVKANPGMIDKHLLSFKEVIPRIVIHTEYKSVQKEGQHLTITEIDFYSNFWIEFDGWRAFYCQFDPDNMKLRIASLKSDLELFHTGEYDVGPGAMDVEISDSNLLLRNIVVVTLALMTKHKNGERTSTFTASRNKSSVYYSEGDETVFKRMFDFKRLPSPQYQKPEPGASGIRKKEHEVIGHYRTYKSGVKVWVRPHRRGDPSLGRITKVFQ